VTLLDPETYLCAALAAMRGGQKAKGCFRTA
jgi:hypothetical protein